MDSAAGSKGTTSRRSGTEDAALTELRNAAATFDFLRQKGDPVQFWEALRLARNRRSLVAPREGEVAPPSPQVEADIRKELTSIRRQMAPLVDGLRRFLSQVQGLPEPPDRLEMALAFLLVTSREQQAVAKWTDPKLHGDKAADKLASLATITDPYREALQPWTLQVSPPEPEAPAGDPEEVRRAMACCEIFEGLQLDAALWETLFLLALESEAVRPALSRLVDDLEAERLEEFQAGAESLHGRVMALRSRYADGVGALRVAIAKSKPSLAEGRAFDVALGLLATTPAQGPKLRTWLESRPDAGDDLARLLGPFLEKSEALLRSVQAPGP